jgi:ribosomal protein S27AE
MIKKLLIILCFVFISWSLVATNLSVENDSGIKESKIKVVYDGIFSKYASDKEIINKKFSFDFPVVVTIDYNPIEELQCEHLKYAESGAPLDIQSVKERNNHRNELEIFYGESSARFMISHTLSYYYDVIYSNYSSHIRLYYGNLERFYSESSFLGKIASDETINLVYISETEVFEDHASRNPSLNTADLYQWPSVLADVGLTGLTYRGAGISIGNLELSIPNNMSIYSGRNQNSAIGSSTDDHSFVICAIHSGNNGIASSAYVQMAALNGSDMVSRVNWLLSSPRNADIINMSAGLSSSGNYTWISSYVDKIIKNSLVTWVISAGNDLALGGVSSPATALNAIAVASLDSNKKIRFSSSSGVSSTLMRKPTITAPGGRLTGIPDVSYNDISGTSLSAPIVTGIIALLMDEFRELQISPEMVMSVITASANTISNQRLPWDVDAGAGLISYQRAREICQNINFDSASNSGESGRPLVKTSFLTIPKGSSITISCFNQHVSVNPNNNVTSTTVSIAPFTRYKLQLLNHSGNVVVEDTGDSNIWLLRYTNSSNFTTFTLKLIQVGSFLSSSPDNFIFSSYGTNNMFSHTFTYSQISGDYHFHNAVCSHCGFSFKQEHELIIPPLQPSAYCGKCGFLI